MVQDISLELGPQRPIAQRFKNEALMTYEYVKNIDDFGFSAFKKKNKILQKTYLFGKIYIVVAYLYHQSSHHLTLFNVGSFYADSVREGSEPIPP